MNPTTLTRLRDRLIAHADISTRAHLTTYWAATYNECKCYHAGCAVGTLDNLSLALRDLGFLEEGERAHLMGQSVARSFYIDQPLAWEGKP